jgi:transcriptional regulator with XRE-family HTH domain
MNKELLRFLRKSCNMTQRELARKMGVTHALINYYENGRKPIAPHRVKQIREIFGDDLIKKAKDFLGV